ncbi:hypothetical protein KR100_01910 [Synechococcus sp. KORDI-100]|uniref:hypothetical protein n=1 Tax=Synechococcus sp. KORDI-100 TaxID=1280380 RepID=UPI0004E09995|nr:hypothetical protein [Synechococcus sp. KORDI-100]AII42160.1 hypothetical protein KR100_01910 [Synechococcus sp. KORDI-100]
MSETTWLLTGPMAAELGISIRSIHHWRSSQQSPWQQGRHFQRLTPADRSPWIWNRELTLKAWDEARKSVEGAA